MSDILSRRGCANSLNTHINSCWLKSIGPVDSSGFGESKYLSTSLYLLRIDRIIINTQMKQLKLFRT